MTQNRLDHDQLHQALAALPGWQLLPDGRLQRQLRFPDFAGAFTFATAVALHAEHAQHHPELTIAWGRVVVSTTTHDAGGITAKDLALARSVDGLYTAPAGP